MRLWDKYSIAELQVIVAAYAYEYKDETLMSDNTYDILVASIESTMKEKLPSYESYTGQWVGLIKEEYLCDLDSLTNECIKMVKECKTDDMLHHTYLEEILGRE